VDAGTAPQAFPIRGKHGAYLPFMKWTRYLTAQADRSTLNATDLTKCKAGGELGPRAEPSQSRTIHDAPHAGVASRMTPSHGDALRAL